MTGLEKMKSQILDEAGKAADVKVAEAKAQAEELIQAARTEAAREAESISRKSEAEVANYKERAASSMDLQKRSRILEAKQAVIAEVLDKAYEKVSTMEKDEYFSMLLKLVGKYALAQDGEICFSAKDLERLPSGFEEQAGEIAAGKGGSLKVSRETRDIPNGFVLVYGGVEENCTLKAMFEAKRDELADKVNHLIFSQA
ncbi:MAG: V-type ATP synthase subunit E [Massilistercora timonensis]|uniref:V-type ATP synthase subunit E n=1 Tax=Massilistercora timonensis TaxID=2086584 RepID=UPI002FA22734